ncbi:hypothetical protein [Caulobacter sp. RL271]|uniref:DUF2188 domain-containing protein n=1 Tax=Caulobacter segnis TaxID=88688 RepID=A0ABY5A1Q1_9CAUL|nr:hypothetical protein [Caulobacter segnis]USQ98514.1 hypothetical protein MZV50_05485 [Caulobacter segnis]
MAENHYYVRPVAGVWHVTWNDSAELIGSYSSQHEAEALGQLLARHMLAQGRKAQLHVEAPEVRTPSWGRNRAAHQAVAA